MEGYLEKYSGGKQSSSSRLRRFSLGFGNTLAKWDRRYFVLHSSSSVMAYHKTSEDASSGSKPALGTATCAGSTVMADKEDPACFTVTIRSESNARVLWLRAADGDTARRWIEAIIRAGATEAFPGVNAAGGDSLQGMLLKQNKGKFEKRYFKLDAGSLSYFKGEADLAAGSKKPPLGSMVIDPSVRVDLPTPRAGDARVVFIVSKDEAIFNLKGSSEEDTRLWIDAIIAAGGTASGTLVAGPSSARSKAKGKRGGISAETGSADDLDAKRIFHPKSDDARSFIFDVVAASALFAGASPGQREQLVDAMEERKTSAGEMIIEQGDAGEHFFVVRSGEYAVLLKQKGDTPVHKYRPGGSFGELALLYNKPRAASIKCTAGGVLYALDRATFRAVLMAGTKQAVDTSTRLLRRVHLLEGLTDTQLQALVAILKEEVYEDGQRVCAEGEEMDSLYMVKEGLVHQTGGGGKGGAGVQPYQVGDCFGQSALADHEEAVGAPTWPGTVTASGGCTLLRLKRDEMVALLGDLSTLMRDNFQQRVLGSIEMFKALSPSELSVLVDALKETRYVTGDKIIKQGDEGDTFYIVKSGRVRVSVQAGSSEKEIAKLGEGEYFGEMALLNATPRMASVTALEPATCMTVDRATFAQVLGPLQAFIEREAERRRQETEALKAQREITLADLDQKTILGVGTFGRVRLVVHRSTGKHYALKSMRKKQLIALKQVEHVMNERTLLAMCNHPFLVGLAGGFQDAVEIYMVLELALGGELFNLLRDHGKMDEAASRFYAGCVVSAFIHLHDKKIVYRDLKPENLLLDEKGYIKICDFGFAKIVPDFTYTLCGTPEYLAPEIISNVGHGLPVDWWALGILIFEMLTGDPPFVADDPMELYQSILRGQFVFPSYIGKTAKDLVLRLLHNNPPQRIGIAKRGHRDLVTHAWLKLLDLNLLVKKTNTPPPPYVPKIAHEADVSNYEIEPGSDQPMDPSWSQPVNAEEQKLFEGFSM